MRVGRIFLVSRMYISLFLGRDVYRLYPAAIAQLITSQKTFILQPKKKDLYFFGRDKSLLVGLPERCIWAPFSPFLPRPIVTVLGSVVSFFPFFLRAGSVVSIET